MDITVPSLDFYRTMHKQQKRVWYEFDNTDKRFYMLNWHRRARKTTLAINLLIAEAYSHKNQVYTYIAPTKTQAVDIVWTDPNMLFKWLPPDTFKKNEQKNDITILPTGSKIRIRGADKVLENSRGIDSAGFILDEFAVFRQQQLFWQSIIRPILSANKGWCFFTFTPKGTNETCTMFHKAKELEEWYTNELTAEHSGLINRDELKNIKEETIKSLYDQEYLCKFVTDEEMTFITSQMIEDLNEISAYEPETRKIVSCDPATGGDECVAYVFENTKIIDTKIMWYKDPNKIAFELASLGKIHETNNYIIDGIGVGNGVVYGLRRMLGDDGNVMSFIAGEKAIKEDIFNSKKSELWWYVSEQMRKNKVNRITDDELKRQLSAVRYKVVSSETKISCVPKEETKKIIGRSPDRADAYIMGIWGISKVDPEKPKDKYRRNKRNYEYSLNPATC